MCKVSSVARHPSQTLQPNHPAVIGILRRLLVSWSQQLGQQQIAGTQGYSFLDGLGEAAGRFRVC